MDEIVIRGPLPVQHMKPAVGNGPWSRRKAAKEMRQDWMYRAMELGPSRPCVKKCKIVYRYAGPSQAYMRQIGVHLPDSKKPYDPTDRDNLRAAAKPALDGLQDGGLLAGDTRNHIIEDPVQYVGRAETGAGWLEIVIIPMEIQ